MILQQAHSYFSSLLTLKNINPKLETRILLQLVCKLNDVDFIVKKNTFILDNSQIQKMKLFINKRNTGYPLAYILQYKHFWKHKFIINDNVLIPRPESELIVENALTLFTDQQVKINILDIGVGSGCLLLSLLLEYKNAKGIGVDISQQALNVSQENANNLNVCNNLTLIKSNIFNNISLSEKFDLIVSNPPYIDINDTLIDENVKKYEPSIALFAQNNGLYFYQNIFAKLNQYLNNDGFAIFEFGIKQSKLIQSLAKYYGLNIYKIVNDLNNIPRVIILNKKAQ